MQKLVVVSARVPAPVKKAFKEACMVRGLKMEFVIAQAVQQFIVAKKDQN